MVGKAGKGFDMGDSSSSSMTSSWAERVMTVDGSDDGENMDDCNVRSMKRHNVTVGRFSKLLIS